VNVRRRGNKLGICAAAALLAGCGGSQPPIGAPSAMPQSATLQRLSARGNAIAAGGYKVLYSFKGPFGATDGAQPFADLTNVGGTLYGTTAYGGGNGCYNQGGCGTVFAMTRFGKERVVYRFTGQPDGAIPLSNLIAVNGKLYGTTQSGGTSNYGTVFSVTTSGVEQVLHSFKGDPDGLYPAGGLVNVNGTFYGLTQFTIYKITPAGKETVIHTFGSQSYNDGLLPVGDLVNLKGTLYGATTKGGSHCRGPSSDGCGAVFSVTTSGKERVIYSFKGKVKGDAEWPGAGLTILSGVLYGTSTIGGGHANRGSVFAVTTSGTEQIVYGFQGSPDGDTPEARLTVVGGSLYGTTVNGGTGCLYSCGTVFNVTTSGSEQVLHSFSGAPDGAHPEAGLTILGHGLYGTTVAGGTIGRYGDTFGTVFRISP
jgi:uncharacterized repeat protein (TIGR03803 family)